ncbi:acyl-CoA-binding protein (ACBP)/diazepam binding inhibitor (DBI)/endozepine (EP) [Tilletia horrida]|uniref:Acyl-CoA-binding protein (ACBP)/diazepam binding inhibitor (DBI)/endozepine (EP) n=1 Tax=Tilletia horrida TaxID=155126 RepID=A0AAN6JHH2_9BASI|nr:acyl-CoA-binding protein (ACBP)/diazepam binding inhibitor (DBI)/endozepine (EP) [Tilletia horrida]KAK0522041.1 acyl-CoA-binding protein (ACBP)/diazepam binding inhibitor (DBI)/endozepine (EP) [Tilletia horrida]KAK0525227.1 acyl-CoA-binding protein (ACBP)/diazepam binding inhibitor (DBI)/endozepine (EP) [Tilletia horrida]KAK0547735.1 acyl-CoA-binding protein (ACBP)/diazepam binding inhibitor (DBI)/endozepine (EP) [Tilletia horrida]
MSAAQFDKAVSLVQGMPKDGPVQPSTSEQLVFYGLFKQATVGDVNTTRPGMLDFTGKAKWDAWNSHKGKSADDAKAEYVQALIDMLEKNKDAGDAGKWLEELQATA